MRALIVGATGFIGRRLAPELVDRGHELRCLVRNPHSDIALELEGIGCELLRGDITKPDSLRGAAEDCDVAYYLVHLIASEDGADAGALVGHEAEAASAVAREARRAEVARMIYLGGLGDPAASPHLAARARTAEVLRDEGPPLTYFRAAMVIGAESASYQLLRSLVERAPALPDADWLGNRTQPIGVKAVVEYLVEAPFVNASRGREIELGGPETMTYGEMVEGMAEALGDDGPTRLPVRKISAASAGRAAGTVTRGDPEMARHLTAGLATDSVVRERSGAALFDVDPEPYELSLARAIEDEARDREQAIRK
jgi:uncharacterized protein YbjT (DUF2867 family)